MRNVECGVWNVECGLRNEECVLRNVECGLRVNFGFGPFRLMEVVLENGFEK